MGLAMVLQDIPDIRPEEVELFKELGIMTPTMLHGSNFDELSTRLNGRMFVERFKRLQRAVNEYERLTIKPDEESPSAWGI